MNGSPVAPPDPSGNDEEVVLRLGDILRRIPEKLLNEGPHDRMRTIRFSVDELAAQISRGSVSIPLSRLGSVCPDIFKAPDELPAEDEIALPLQRLLDQIGLVANRSPVQSNIPKAQVEQAREVAERILTAIEADKHAGDEPSPPFAVAKALSAAKHFLGFFGRNSESAAASPPEATPPPEAAAPPAPAAPPTPSPVPEPAAPQPVAAEGFIALRVRPIFQLLPGEAIEPGFEVPEEARAIFPLALIDPQLASGHVEVPLEELTKALPEKLRSSLRPVNGVQAWIPLDEIFQSLPETHLYYMPPLEAVSETAPESPVETEAEKAPAPATESAEPAPPVEKAPDAQAGEPGMENKASHAGQASEPAPSTEGPAGLPAVEQAPEAQPEEPVAAEEPSRGEETLPADESPAPAEASPEAESNSEPVIAPPPPEKTATGPEEEPRPVSRAPWMRGFIVPPPRLFARGGTSPEQPADVAAELPPAKTPEAKQTADFLAGQPGIFAAAAFVQGAIFASADFPRKPDLETLRDLIGAFVENARESAQRLGWNGLLTLACEQFFVTAVVRESHFIVALHHERVLPPAGQDALLAAAGDLGKAASENA